MNIRITCGKVSQSSEIATLIMEAMNHECCQNLAGPGHTLDDFHRLMTRLVELTDSQYSYLNTTCAVTDEGALAGICVTYNGADLLKLRRRFIEGAKEAFGIDYSSMAEETKAGELYVDSLCVDARYRGQGIATRLLQAVVGRARELQLPAVGLLVDQGNPRAEALYNKVGFRFVEESAWGGHPMKHLQYKL